MSLSPIPRNAKVLTKVVVAGVWLVPRGTGITVARLLVNLTRFPINPVASRRRGTNTTKSRTVTNVSTPA